MTKPILPAGAKLTRRSVLKAGLATTALTKIVYTSIAAEKRPNRESGRMPTSDHRQWFKSVAPDLNPDATGIGWNDHRAKAYVLTKHLHPTA